MSQRPRIVIAQQQRLALNTSLHASIRLLRSDTAGLTRYLEEQAAENPHLRLIPPQPAAFGDWLPRWSGVLHFGSRAAPDPDLAAAAQPSLIAHVTAAVQAMALPRHAQRIALALVETLEPSGWLGRPVGQIAKELGVPPDEVSAVLVKLQDIDPPGLFAQNLSECLILQARDQGKLDAQMLVILRNLDLLAVGDSARLARLCNCDEAGIISRFRIIRAMNPKPGSLFGSAPPATLREPDLIARPLKDGRWQVALNNSALPSLEVSNMPGGGQDSLIAPQPAQLTAARSLCHMLQARNETLLRVGREIVARQISALLQGPGALKPMVMADLAETLGLHVSTISRVVAGASLDSPQGVWWLRRMFSGARSSAAPEEGATGDAPRIAVAALRHHLGRIIASESPDAPLSDARLAERLAQESGVQLARRTVAQYREAENIPPAHRRRKGPRSRKLRKPAPPTG